MFAVLSATFLCFFCTASAAPEIYTLSLHDALPISLLRSVAGTVRRETRRVAEPFGGEAMDQLGRLPALRKDRKSTRLNSSHVKISYAVFCLKKKNECQRLTNNPTKHAEAFPCTGAF